MSPTRAEAVAVAIDRAEALAASTGRGIADAAEDLDVVARRLGASPAEGGWSGRVGGRARESAVDAAAGARMLAGACLFLSDVLRVEGAGLARAVIAWDDDEAASPGSGDGLQVADSDRALVMRLREAADSLAGLVDPDTRPCLDLAGTTLGDPRAVAQLWHSLGPADRERLARDNPELGSVAGLSSATRDAINRTRLRRLLDAVDRGGAGTGTGVGGGDGADLTAAGPGLTALAAYLEAYPRRHLIDLHADGRAVVASGNPDVAGRVVTLIPGTGSSLESLGRTGERADAMCEAAAVVGSSEPGGAGTDEGAGTDDGAGTDEGAAGGGAIAGGGEPVDAGTEACVSVAWQGYDAPDSIPEAGRSLAPARAHADDLRTFAAGVDAVEVMDGHDAPHTVVGYSYGSAALGAAAADPRGLAADRMIHVGSPGASVDSIGQQWVDEGGTSRRAHRWEVVAVASRWDAVPWWSVTGVLGERPGTAEFGGTAVDVTEPGTGPGSVGDAHSTYFDRGTVSLEEIGRLIADTD